MRNNKSESENLRHNVNEQTADEIGLSASSCCAPPISGEATGLNEAEDPVEEDFGISLDIIYDDPSPFINPIRLSTIGALFIDYCDEYWQDKIIGWLKDAESKNRLEEKEKDGVIYSSYRPFQTPSFFDRKP